jgi:hypothetical protein
MAIEPSEQLGKAQRVIGQNFMAHFAVGAKQSAVELGFGNVNAEKMCVHKKLERSTL